MWQLYAAFAAMAFGWSCMSLAAINIIVAPWFEARRGVALSLALTGASCGGMVISPLLLGLVEALGFAAGLRLAVAVMLATLLPVVLVVLRRTPADMDVGRRQRSGRVARADNVTRRCACGLAIRRRGFSTAFRNASG